MPDLGSVCPHTLGSCVGGCVSGLECSCMSPLVCVCPCVQSAGQWLREWLWDRVGLCGQLCVCVCVSAMAVSMCPQAGFFVCVHTVLVYRCVPMSVRLLPRLCVFQPRSESSSSCPAGVLATAVATSISRPSVCPPVLLGRGGAGREGKRRGEGVSTSPPTPAPSPHSLGPRIEPYLESRFDICFQI